MALKDTALAQECIDKCKTAQIWSQLDAEDQQILVDWVDAGIGAKKIASALTEDGHRIAQGVILCHVQAECCCDSEHSDVLHGRRTRKVTA